MRYSLHEHIYEETIVPVLRTFFWLQKSVFEDSTKYSEFGSIQLKIVDMDAQ
jgi:hypothetical protein